MVEVLLLLLLSIGEIAIAAVETHAHLVVIVHLACYVMKIADLGVVDFVIGDESYLLWEVVAIDCFLMAEVVIVFLVHSDVLFP